MSTITRYKPFLLLFPDTSVLGNVNSSKQPYSPGHEQQSFVLVRACLQANHPHHGLHALPMRTCQTNLYNLIAIAQILSMAHHRVHNL